MSIKTNLKKINDEIAGRGVTLCAVSKFHSEEAIMEAYGEGQRIFGENLVQELVPKYRHLPKDIEWHLIGHLQTNKVRLIAPFVAMVQSVDSERLLKELNKEAEKCGRKIKILLQVHIAQEEHKFGFSEEEMIKLFASGAVKKYENLLVCGLMGMATFTDDENRIRAEFRRLKRLSDNIRENFPVDKINFTEISMGMSDDFNIAIEEGSSIIRIGSRIFGRRF